MRLAVEGQYDDGHRQGQLEEVIGEVGLLGPEGSEGVAELFDAHSDIIIIRWISWGWGRRSCRRWRRNSIR